MNPVRNALSNFCALCIHADTSRRAAAAGARIICHNAPVSRHGEAGTDPEPTGRAADSDGRPYRLLRQEILDGAIRPGDLLLETALSTRYEVSRTPIRVALVRLEHDGLVERASRGFRVRVGSAEDVLDIYEARIALESTAAAGAALRRTDLELARLTHLHQESVGADVPVAADLHRQWHEVLWTASHNLAIASTLVRLCSQLTIFDPAPMLQPGSLDAACDEHRHILDAIADRDPDAARDAVAAHLTRTRETRLAVLAKG